MHSQHESNLSWRIIIGSPAAVAASYIRESGTMTVSIPNDFATLNSSLREAVAWLVFSAGVLIPLIEDGSGIFCAAWGRINEENHAKIGNVN